MPVLHRVGGGNGLHFRVEIRSRRLLDGGTVRLDFSDGVQALVDLDPLLRGPVFDEVRRPEVFRCVRVNRETGTVEWPNGADLDPAVLRAAAAPPAPAVSGN